MARFLISFLILVSVSASAETRNLEALYEKAQFTLGSKKITAYIADNDTRRSQGLMFIESLPKDTGMLFVFEQEQPLAFWMKNTLIPLSIGYFNTKGELMEVQEMNVASSLMSVSPPSYPSRSPGLFALEMTQGWFKQNGINPGVRLQLVSKAKSSLLNAKLKSRQ